MLIKLGLRDQPRIEELLELDDAILRGNESNERRKRERERAQGGAGWEGTSRMERV